MPPKARVTSKSTTASNTSMTTRSEPTICNSVDSDNELLIETTQEQSSSIINGVDYGQFANRPAGSFHVNSTRLGTLTSQISFKFSPVD